MDSAFITSIEIEEDKFKEWVKQILLKIDFIWVLMDMTSEDKEESKYYKTQSICGIYRVKLFG